LHRGNGTAGQAECAKPQSGGFQKLSAVEWLRHYVIPKNCTMSMNSDTTMTIDSSNGTMQSNPVFRGGPQASRCHS
jgi:hypothetical protein